jgi:hypothetical protein
MSLAVDNPIINNHFEEPKEYWIYEELAVVGKKIEDILRSWKKAMFKPHFRYTDKIVSDKLKKPKVEGDN